MTAVRSLRGLVITGGVVWIMAASGSAADRKIPVTFSGGHETDPKDGGRPVVLVSAGLGVKPEVFREAFRGVTPAKGRGPSPDEARRNKGALMKVLKPHGITNDRLDEVSDYYRYRPEKGELWPTVAAKAHAVVADGEIKDVVVTEPGSGYSSPPKVTVKGFDDVQFQVTLKFVKDLKKNGGIESIRLVDAK